jgi:hypothetical protein
VGPAAARRKLELLRQLDRTRLANPRQILQLHEYLCHWRAFPDDREVLNQVDSMLARFAHRADLRRHRSALADTGIAGTAIYYRFFWFTAAWLAARWPNHLHIDWANAAGAERLRALLPLLATQAESAATESAAPSARHGLERLRGPHETDATFLVRRFAALPLDSFLREWLYESFDLMLRLDPGPTTPSRTLAARPVRRIIFTKSPTDAARPDLRRALRVRPRSVRDCSPQEGDTWIDAARVAMVTRSRDLDVFETADRRDVRRVDCGDGLVLVVMGVLPERRFLLDCAYGMLLVQNGVPIGYTLVNALFGSAAVAFNIFASFRRAGSAAIYGRVLAAIRSLFGCDAFTVDPYQLGHDNDEGLRSGAWWFYYKLGFRPHDPRVKDILRAELRARQRDPRHRSKRAVLQALSAAHVFWYAGKPRRDVLGRIDLERIGAHASRLLAIRYGAERERGLADCAREAGRRLGVTLPTSSREVGAAWRRWSPLILSLPGVEKWSDRDKCALAAVARAKGGRREVDFLHRFDAHRPLRRALLRLAAMPPP